MPLPKQYDAKEAEKRWQQHWLQSGVYAWDETASREDTYVIDTPPPTVSGLLHMGHIYSYTQADFMARYQRMNGKSVFYPMGFDDNGLPTERLVEKAKKIRPADVGREKFIEECMSVSEEARAEFRELFRSVALSVDWNQEYHTISEESRRISQASFLDLYSKGHAYRELKPFFWDPVDQTAIAQAEIEDKELASHFSDIAFGIEGTDETLTIGTTRPELIPACVAIFYHPEDARYQHLKGKFAVTPLFGVKVPILEDETVEPEKGTGIMMCCTFGDEKDIEKWRKHKLATRVILNKFGKLDEALLQEALRDAAHPEAAAQLAKLKVSNSDPKNPGARQKILEMLAASGDLVENKPITHTVKCAERSGAPLEILPTQQWFVRLMDKKEALLTKSRECEWKPDFMRHRIEQWIEGLSSDWCISRQRYFGVPFPVWYVQKLEMIDGKRTLGEVYLHTADETQLPINPIKDLPIGFKNSSTPGKFIQEGESALLMEGCFIGEATEAHKIDEKIVFQAGDTVLITPDKDVMDTWATSSISPQLAAKGINKDFMWDERRFGKLFPADVRPQAHEIIRTWAFYTIAKALLHGDTIPWKTLMISGWCLAADKTKMSKSKGNVVTPVALIEEKSADAVRYWASTSRLGADTAFSEDLLKIGKKLVTKLWNASQFVAMQLEPNAGNIGTESSETLDKWILSRLHRTVKKAGTDFAAYEYADARAAIDDFFWNDFCDNYLELVKARAYDPENPGQASALYTLQLCLNTLLKLYAPFLPHVTEEIFSHLFASEYKAKGSIHACGLWPRAEDFAMDEEAEKAGIATVEILEAVRKAKSERAVSIKTPVSLLQISGGAADLSGILTDLASAANAEKIEYPGAPSANFIATSGDWKLNISFGDQTIIV